MWRRANTALRRQLCRGNDCHQIHSLQDSRSFTEIWILLGKAGKTPILLAEEYIKSVQTLLVYFHWGGTTPPLTVLEYVLFLLLGFIRISKSYKVSSDERRERGWEEGFSSQNAAIWNVTRRVSAVLQESPGLDHTACENTRVCAPGVARP